MTDRAEVCVLIRNNEPYYGVSGARGQTAVRQVEMGSGPTVRDLAESAMEGGAEGRLVVAKPELYDLPCARQCYNRPMLSGWMMTMRMMIALAVVAVHLSNPASVLAQVEGDGLRSVLVELWEPSVSDVWLGVAGEAGDGAVETASAVAAAQVQLQAVVTQQESVVAAMAGLGAVELYRAQRVYNGIAVRVPASSLGSLRSIPGVRRVRALTPKMPGNANSAPFIGAPELWQGITGLPLTGKGVTIGIIDTGIDYLHTAFGGPGSGYKQNDVTRIQDIAGFPGRKVVGGYDFAGDLYDGGTDSESGPSVPQPDPDPYDCYGHGTHVAASAAGYGVVSDGATYGGPYANDVDFDSLLIGPGVAPEAALYAIKVFGCRGSSDIVDVGIEWAVDPNGDGDFRDHLDVINLSLGSGFGAGDDSTAQAADRAAQLGVVVVASAGNSGDVTYAAGSPGVATRVISVAASRADSTWDGSAPSENDTRAGFSSRGPRRGDSALKPDVSAPGNWINSASAGSGWGSRSASGTSMAAPQVAGAMALLRQLHPGWSVEALKALIMGTAAPPIRVASAYTSTLVPPQWAGAGRVDLVGAARANVIAYGGDAPGMVSLSFGAPEVQVSRSDVRNLRVENRSTSTLTLTAEYLAVHDLPGATVRLPTMATFSLSGGGQKVLPVTFGADAAALQNLSDPSRAVDASGKRSALSEESGHIWLWQRPAQFAAKLSGDVVGSASATFVYDPVTDSLTYEVKLAKPSDAASVTGVFLARGLADESDLAPAYELYERGGGPAPVFPLKGSVTIQARDVPLLAAGYLRLALATGATKVVATAGRVVPMAPVIRVPVHAAPRPVSSMQAAADVLDVGSAATGAFALRLAGTTLSYTVTPTTTRPLVGVFELHAVSPLVAADAGGGELGSADIQSVGVTSVADATGEVEETLLFFAIAAHWPWATPNEVQYVVAVDTNGDGVDDFSIYNDDARTFGLAGQQGDAFMTRVQDNRTSGREDGLPINVLLPGDVNTALFNSRVMILGVRAGQIGLTAEETRFAFRVISAPLVGDGLVAGDEVGWMTFDAARPGLRVVNSDAGTPLLTDAPATVIQLAFRRDRWVTSTARGILLLHLHNGVEKQAEMVDLVFKWPYVQRLPIVQNR